MTWRCLPSRRCGNRRSCCHCQRSWLSPSLIQLSEWRGSCECQLALLRAVGQQPERAPDLKSREVGPWGIPHCHVQWVLLYSPSHWKGVRQRAARAEKQRHGWAIGQHEGLLLGCPNSLPRDHGLLSLQWGWNRRPDLRLSLPSDAPGGSSAGGCPPSYMSGRSKVRSDALKGCG